MAKRLGSSNRAGRGRPPRASQFKPGRSGNPKGRPKGSRNFATVLKKELGKRVPVTVNGARKTITMERAVAKQLVTKAASGDPRIMAMLLKELGVEDSGPAAPAVEEIFNRAEDKPVLESIIRRIRKMDDPALDPDPGSSAPTQSKSFSTPDSTEKP